MIGSDAKYDEGLNIRSMDRSLLSVETVIPRQMIGLNSGLTEANPKRGDKRAYITQPRTPDNSTNSHVPLTHMSALPNMPVEVLTL